MEFSSQLFHSLSILFKNSLGKLQASLSLLKGQNSLLSQEYTLFLDAALPIFGF